MISFACSICRCSFRLSLCLESVPFPALEDCGDVTEIAPVTLYRLRDCGDDPFCSVRVVEVSEFIRLYRPRNGMNVVREGTHHFSEIIIRLVPRMRRLRLVLTRARTRYILLMLFIIICFSFCFCFMGLGIR